MAGDCTATDLGIGVVTTIRLEPTTRGVSVGTNPSWARLVLRLDCGRQFAPNSPDRRVDIVVASRADVVAVLLAVHPDGSVLEQFRSDDEFGRSTDAIVGGYPVFDDAAVSVRPLPRLGRVGERVGQSDRVSARLG